MRLLIQKIYVIVVIFIATPCLPVQAQWLPQARRVTIAQGLTDNRITALAQDSTGFIWVGTPYGLNRFDGFSVTTFVPSVLPSLSNEVINDIEADAQGNLWVATHGGGLNKLNLQTMQWKVVEQTLRKAGGGYLSPVVWDISADPDGTIWVANDGAYFVKYEPDKEDFTYYNFGDFIRKNRPANLAAGYYAINKCLRKDANHWWLGFNKGLALLNTSTGVFTLLGEGFDDNINQMVWNEWQQKIFITLENGELYSYHNPTGNFRAEDILPASQNATFFSPNTGYVASSKGLLQIAAQQPGVHNNQQYAFIESQILDSIPVNCFLRSKHQIIFVGTNEGLYFFSATPAGNHYFPLYAKQTGPNANGTTSVLAIDSLGLIFATAGSPASLFIINEKEGWVKQLNKDGDGKPLSPCIKVKAIGSDIWVLTTQNIYKYKVKGNKLTPWLPAGSLKAGYFRDIAVDNDGRIWVAGFTIGTWCWNPLSAQWSMPTAPNKTGAATLAWDGKAGRMWVGYFGRGLHGFHNNPKENIFFNEYAMPGLKATMDLVNEVIIGDDESVWVATHTGGLFRWTQDATDSFKHTRLHMQSGSISNQFIALTKGNNGQVFAMHNRGIVITDTQYNEHALPLPLSSFALYSDPVWPHSMHYQYETNKLLVPVQGGIFSIPTKDSTIAPFPIRIYAQPAKMNSAESLINSSISSITLSYNHASVQFLVSPLYFGTTPLLFEYRLNDGENEWQPLAEMPYLRFDQLASGNYSLIIRAKMQSGQIVTQSDIFYITVKAPFWKSGWFLLIIVSLLAAGIVMLIKRLQGKIADEKKLSQFSTRFYGNFSLDDILWDAAESINQLLGFEDCIIYEVNASQQLLVQRTAAGAKRPYHNREIINPLEIAMGKGITGAVAQSGKPERVGNTSRDTRYIVDDAVRLSELTVPIWIDNAIFGVIDTEHPKKNFYTYRQQKLLEKMAAILSDRIKKYVTEEKLRNKIARDLHDDIGSTLTSISVISKVAQAQPDLSAKARQAMQQIHHRTTEVLDNMSDIVWVINPANDDPAMLLAKMKEWLSEWAEPAGITLSFDTNEAALQLSLNMEERKNCYLIFKEAVSNAIKYSGCSHIKVSVKSTENILSISIADNGNGFNTKTNSSGNGLNNMQQRAKSMGGRLQIISNSGIGTTIELEKRITPLG